jgi:hypothetical protein
MLCLQLDRWSDTDGSDSGRKQLQLLVPPGQQELGQRLITAMYADQPDLSDLTPVQLVQLTLLAESYDVPKVVAAAARALGQLKPEQLTVHTVNAVLALPDSCLELDCFVEVRVKAGDQLQHQFGDLEEVWADDSKTEQLLELPYAAMLQLVQDSRTRVASEDTIVYTLGRWLAQHPDTSSKQKQQLADTVRLPLCTATFLSSSDAIAWLLDAGYTQRELLMACLLHGSRQQEERTEWVINFGEHRAAWQRRRRHRSNRRTADVSWVVPLADVRGLVEQEADRGQRSLFWPEPCFIWHGRELQLCLGLDDDADSIKLYVSGDNSYSSIFCRLQASRTAGGVLKHDTKGNIVEPDYMQGCLELVPVPSADGQWAAVEAALREARLVHDDGCLHLKIVITRIE